MGSAPAIQAARCPRSAAWRASARHGGSPAAAASKAKTSAKAAVTLRGPVVRCLPGASPRRAFPPRLGTTAAPARRTAAASAT